MDAGAIERIGKGIKPEYATGAMKSHMQPCDPEIPAPPQR